MTGLWGETEEEGTATTEHKSPESDTKQCIGQESTVTDWERELRSDPSLEFAPDILKYLNLRNEQTGGLKWEHATMKQALVNMNLMEEVRCYMAPEKNQLFAVWTFGREMVGHPKVVHGGAIGFAFDESFGILYASLGRGPGFTANLSIDYRKPFPAQTAGCLQAEVVKTDRRKVYLSGKMRTKRDGEIYAEATALFIVAKKE